VDHLERALEFRPGDREQVNSATRIVRYIAEQRNLSLRSIERIMSGLAVVFATTSETVFRPPPILGGLSVLKVIEPELYNKAKRGKLTYEEVRKALDLDAEVDEQDRIGDWYIDWWRFCTDAELDQAKIQEFGRSLLRYGIDDRFDVVPFVVEMFDVVAFVRVT